MQKHAFANGLSTLGLCNLIELYIVFSGGAAGENYGAGGRFRTSVESSSMIQYNIYLCNALLLSPYDVRRLLFI